MKLFYLLLIITVLVEASVARSDDSLEQPQITYLIGSFPSITVMWKLVPSPPTNSVRGYKVKLWEQQTRLVKSLELVDDVYVCVEKEELMPFTGNIPDWEPKEEHVARGSSTNLARFDNLKTGIVYEVRVQAFSLREEGPLSLPSRIDFV